MPKQTVSYLKNLFITGARPLQSWWHDLFDSFVHKDDLAAVNQSIVNTAINAYDQQQKAQTPNGEVDTIGDVFKLFQNYSDTRNLNSELKWDGIPGRPTVPIPLKYEEQRLAFFNISPADWPYHSGSGSTVASEKSLKGLMNIPAGTDTVITDIFFLRYTINIAGQNVNFLTITMVDMALNPRTTI